jgi:hypothetical protein
MDSEFVEEGRKEIAGELALGSCSIMYFFFFAISAPPGDPLVKMIPSPARLEPTARSV